MSLFQFGVLTTISHKLSIDVQKSSCMRRCLVGIFTFLNGDKKKVVFLIRKDFASRLETWDIVCTYLFIKVGELLHGFLESQKSSSDFSMNQRGTKKHPLSSCFKELDCRCSPFSSEEITRADRSAIIFYSFSVRYVHERAEWRNDLTHRLLFSHMTSWSVTD